MINHLVYSSEKFLEMLREVQEDERVYFVEKPNRSLWLGLKQGNWYYIQHHTNEKVIKTFMEKF